MFPVAMDLREGKKEERRNGKWQLVFEERASEVR